MFFFTPVFDTGATRRRYKMQSRFGSQVWSFSSGNFYNERNANDLVE